MLHLNTIQIGSYASASNGLSETEPKALVILPPPPPKSEPNLKSAFIFFETREVKFVGSVPAPQPKKTGTISENF
jgi:hypothetical protein